MYTNIPTAIDNAQYSSAIDARYMHDTYSTVLDNTSGVSFHMQELSHMRSFEDTVTSNLNFGFAWCSVFKTSSRSLSACPVC